MTNTSFHNIICPIDSQPLSLKNKSLICESGHCFDIAKQGYINLLPVQQKKSLSPGDSKPMALARSRFLDSGVYQPTLNKLIKIIEALELPEHARILDAGCGEGYYTQKLGKHFLQHQFTGLDISKEAIKISAKRSDSINWIVASNSQIPLEPNSIDLIVCVFGFHSFTGFQKVLKPNGLIILVDPEEKHLIELRETVYEHVNERPAYSIDDAENEQLTLTKTLPLTFTSAELTQGTIQDLLLMTPHLFRASTQGKEKARAIDKITLTIDVSFRVLIKNP